MKFAIPTVASACHQFMPADIRPDASVYVVSTTLMPIHMARMCQVFQVRSRGPAGARSSLYSGEPATDRRSASTSASVLNARSWNACVVSVMPFSPNRERGACSGSSDGAIHRMDAVEFVPVLLRAQVRRKRGAVDVAARAGLDMQLAVGV